jgi:hypothetical protein
MYTGRELGEIAAAVIIGTLALGTYPGSGCHYKYARDAANQRARKGGRGGMSANHCGVAWDDDTNTVFHRWPSLRVTGSL